MPSTTRKRKSSARLQKLKEDVGVEPNENEARTRKRRKLEHAQASEEKVANSADVPEKRKKRTMKDILKEKKEKKNKKKKDKSKKSKKKKDKSNKRKSSRKKKKKMQEQVVDDQGFPIYDSRDFSDGDADDGALLLHAYLSRYMTYTFVNRICSKLILW